MTNIKLRDVFSHPAFFLATGFGIGLIPYAPGTWGSLLGILFYLALHSLGWALIWELVIILLFFFLALLACNITLEKFAEINGKTIEELNVLYVGDEVLVPR